MRLDDIPSFLLPKKAQTKKVWLFLCRDHYVLSLLVAWYMCMCTSLHSHIIQLLYFVRFNKKNVVFVFNWMHIVMHTSQACIYLHLHEKVHVPLDALSKIPIPLSDLLFFVCTKQNTIIFFRWELWFVLFFWCTNRVISHKSNTV